MCVTEPFTDIKAQTIDWRLSLLSQRLRSGSVTILVLYQFQKCRQMDQLTDKMIRTIGLWANLKTELNIILDLMKILSVRHI